MGVQEKFTVLSFDMAKGNTGWNLLEYDTVNNKFKILKVGVITPHKISSKAIYKDDVNKFGEPVVTFYMLELEIEKLIKNLKPDFLAAESAWHRKFLTAYASLIMCLLTAKMVGRRNGLPLYEISPPQAKACINNSGRSNKEDIIQAVKTNPNIEFISDKDKENLTKDQSDSISIGYTFCVQILPSLICKK